jgi:hypothetical protein
MKTNALVPAGLLLLAAALTGGCASTTAYTGKATSIQVRERVNEEFGGRAYGPSQRLSKLVSVDNPYERDVRATVDCGWDSRWDLVIEARTSQRILVTPQRAKAYKKSCYVVDWSFDGVPLARR